MGTAADLCKDVAAVLNAQSFSMPFTAIYEPIPRTDLQSVRSLEVFVCCDLESRERINRAAWKKETSVQIGILKHINKLNRVTEIDAMIALVNEVAGFIGDAPLPNCPWAQPVRFQERPLYHFEHIYQYSVFSSVLSLVYLSGVRRG